MTCWVEVGDVFAWTADYKNVHESDTIKVTFIRVDEDAVAWVDIINYRGDLEKVAATDIQEKVEEGLLEKQ